MNDGDRHPTLAHWTLKSTSGCVLDMSPPSEPFCWVRDDGFRTQTFNTALEEFNPVRDATKWLQRLDEQNPMKQELKC